MNNFDDLFEQQPQAEAAPQKQESQKERPKRQWWQIREEKQRKEAYATLDRIFGEFSEGTGSMEAYLDVQSRFPFHSARNALLIGDKCPDAVRVGGYKEWHAQGIEILEDEKRLPIIILEPGKAYRREDGSVGQNFYAKEVYDISQTTARDQVQPQVRYDDRLLLKGLIASSPVPIRAVEELPQGRGAMFSAEQNAILVKKGMDAPDIFRCVSLEVANVQLAQSMDGYCLLFIICAFLMFMELELMNDGAFLSKMLATQLDRLDFISDIPVLDGDGKDIVLKSYEIELKDVIFAYDSRPVLDGITLKIPQNSTCAIVGPSGSGKTTLCNMIARFWDVNSGSVKIGGHDVKEFTCDSLLSYVSMVFQKVYLFNDTIENNIKFGKPNATHAEVVEAAKRARCHDFIEALPQGYETMIGEAGSTLSGGEKQRISIARAILKDAPIVILDEATSSVDPENEKALLDAIFELTKNKTLISIAHRLSTVRTADQIIVIDQGHIVQKGTHKELAEKEGIYRTFLKCREKSISWKL